MANRSFRIFCNNFELTLNAVSATNPFLIVANDDFNAKSSNWYTVDTTTSEGFKIEAIILNLNYSKLLMNRLTFHNLKVHYPPAWRMEF